MNHAPNVVLGAIAALCGLAVVSAVGQRPHCEPAPDVQLEAPVPIQEWTTADAGPVLKAVLGTLPEPDPRQLRTEKDCRKALGQVIINGACWQLLAVPPPCPTADGAFAHEDGRCYVRVLRAERSPTSGGDVHGNARVSGTLRDSEP